MTPYYEDDACVIYHGDCLDVLPDLAGGVKSANPQVRRGILRGPGTLTRHPAHSPNLYERSEPMSERICSVDACSKAATRREWCNTHYRRWLKHGDPTVLKQLPNGTYVTCTVDGCGKPHHAKGLCASHHGRLRYHGDPLAGGPERIFGDRTARFHSHVATAGADECWHWTGSVTPNGYGQFFDDGSLVAAHRVALELATGERPPDELDVDHVCHNGDMGCPGGPECMHRRCCNPSHLEAVTHAVNVRRGHRFARVGPR